jgi:hypothetical protein
VTEPPGGNPVFRAVSGYGAVLIDEAGVTLTSDAGTLDLRWPDIDWVQCRFQPPKTLLVLVRRRSGQLNNCVVKARRRSVLTQWQHDARLVLAHYRKDSS